MSTVSFQNKGLIDLVSIKTFGISAKDCEDPIGFFGTGLKYAIAILLRNKCTFTLYRGTEEIIFSTVTATVRDKDFEVVCMTNLSTGETEELGFTLELGKTWELWQAFRELYCNTVDERGETFGNQVPLIDDHTTIIITGDAFYEEYVNRDKIILSGKAQYKMDKVEIMDRPSTTIYYQSIRVGNLEYPSIFTYNLLKDIALTEDRTVKEMHQVNTSIRQAILRSEDVELIEKFITAPKESYEGSVDMNHYETPSAVFLDIVERTPFHKISNYSIIELTKKHRKKIIKPVPIEVNSIEQQQLDKAITFSHKLNFSVDKFPIHVTDDLKDTTLGCAYHKEIYIARRTFTMGTKMVAATLIEEYIHLEKAFADCEYPMQNFLFETIVSLGEQLIGEPL